MIKEALDSDALEIAYIQESAAWGEITWEGVLKQIAEIIPGTSLHSIHHDPFAIKALTLSGYGVDDVIADSFRRYYIGINPWAPVIAALPSGSVFVSDRQMPAYTVKNTEYYGDYYSRFYLRGQRNWSFDFS